MFFFPLNFLTKKSTLVISTERLGRRVQLLSYAHLNVQKQQSLERAFQGLHFCEALIFQEVRVLMKTGKTLQVSNLTPQKGVKLHLISFSLRA